MAIIRLLVLFVTILGITNAIGFAQEPLSAQKPVRDAAASEQLARLRFPLPDQGSFGDDLSLLRDVLAAKIRHPAPYHYPGGKVLNRELDEIFDLLAVWPSQQLRQPLADHFESSDVYVIESAKALLAFKDESAREVVKLRSDYKRAGIAGCFYYVESIDALLQEELPVRETFQPLAALLPPQKEGEFLRKLAWSEGMTCPQAISQLKDENISVRLQSWAWLAERGIVAPADPVLECWPHLTDEQKRYIASLNAEYIGAHRLLALYEEVNRTSSPSMQGRLLVRRVELGSESAKTEARGILRRTLERDDWESLLSKPPGEYALDAICRAPDPEDIPVLVRFRGARDEEIAYCAMWGLCRIDHPDAIKEVEKILLAPREQDSLGLGYSLQQQAKKSLKYRWLYLGTLAKALQQRQEFDIGYSELIDAFYAMSGRNFGWNGLSLPGGANQEAMQKAAKKCIEWYLKECPLRIN